MFSGSIYLSSLQGWVGQKGFSLDRVTAVAAYLGNPQNQIRTIHIAGTNGKGSTAASIASILSSAGYKVGLSTSPHLVSINERIQLSGLPISDDMLSEYAGDVLLATEALKVELSQFEAIILISFLVFKDLRLDFSVIEVGLGGRLDATNIISKPDITAIVSIGMDHQEILGDSIEKIAVEKAGIMKRGSPLILGKMDSIASDVIRKQAKNSAVVQVSEYNKDFSVEVIETQKNLQKLLYKKNNLTLNIETSLLGEHQASNVGVAVEASKLLGISDEAIQAGIAKTFWPARLEQIEFLGKAIIIDGAHNVDGILSVIKYLRLMPGKPQICIFGALKNKDWKGMLLELSKEIKQWFVVEPDSDSAVIGSEIIDFISKHELGSAINYARDYKSLLETLAALPQNTSVLALGSLYMVGKLRNMLLTLRQVQVQDND